MSKVKKQKPVEKVTPAAGGISKVKKVLTPKSVVAIALAIDPLTKAETKQVIQDNPEVDPGTLQGLRKMNVDMFLDNIANSQEAQSILQGLKNIAAKVHEKYILLAAEEIKAGENK